jgi:hypothetical protein
VCWALLCLLRRKANIFNVRGKHATVYPVQLPPWLPRQILVEMVDQFKGHLLENLIAIEKMMDSAKEEYFATTHSPTPSMDSIESDSAMSSSSGESVAPRRRGFPIVTEFNTKTWKGYW